MRIINEALKRDVTTLREQISRMDTIELRHRLLERKVTDILAYLGEEATRPVQRLPPLEPRR